MSERRENRWMFGIRYAHKMQIIQMKRSVALNCVVDFYTLFAVALHSVTVHIPQQWGKIDAIKLLGSNPIKSISVRALLKCELTPAKM